MNTGANAKQLKGNLFALLAFFCMALMGIFVKVATKNDSVIWISFFLYLTGAVCMVPIMLKDGVKSVQTQHMWKHFFRALFGVTASFLYMLSLTKIPIVNATLLFNTSPLFIPIIAILWLKIHVPLRSWLAILLGFVGIIIIIKPTMQIFEQLGDLYGLTSGITLAVAYLLVKVLTSTDSSKTIVFYFLVLGTLLQIPFLYFAGPLPAIENIGYAIAAGLIFLGAQLFLVEAYRYITASQVGVYQYTSVVFVGILDWIIWGFVPPLSDIFGVILVAIAGIIVIRSGNDHAMQQKQEQRDF